MEGVTYTCPACGAALQYDGGKGKWVCPYCDTQFDLEDLEVRGDETHVEVSRQEEPETVSQEDMEQMQAYVCPSCGAQIMTDQNTAATFCMFCGNPAVLPERLNGNFRPKKVLPFSTTKEDAKAAFLRQCKGKKLLPKGYTSQQQLEKITGIYVPFWVFDSKADFTYHAVGEKRSTWTDTKFVYTKTDLYQIDRQGTMNIAHVPLDASEKMDDAMMDALEPFDLSKAVPFEMGYLSGFFAEKYTYLPKDLFERMTEHVQGGAQQQVESTIPAYDAVRNKNCTIHFQSTKEEYMLLPVWMLVSSFEGKQYLFAMNGQTGKMVGNLPISKEQCVKWFFIYFGIFFVFFFVIIFFFCSI